MGIVARRTHPTDARPSQSRWPYDRYGATHRIKFDGAGGEWPDAIVDVNMPRLTGLQVTRKLSDQKSPVKLVLLTMHEDEDLLNEALNLGIRGYVLKENAVEDLLAAIHAVAEERSFISATLSSMRLRRHNEGENLRREKPGLEQLTPTELRILKLIAEDRTSKEIAEEISAAPCARWRRTGRT